MTARRKTNGRVTRALHQGSKTKQVKGRRLVSIDTRLSQVAVECIAQLLCERRRRRKGDTHTHAYIHIDRKRRESMIKTTRFRPIAPRPQEGANASKDKPSSAAPAKSTSNLKVETKKVETLTKVRTMIDTWKEIACLIFLVCRHTNIDPLVFSSPSLLRTH